MEIVNTGIEDLFILKPKVFADERGYFYESYSTQALQQIDLCYDFVQDNQSLSRYGTLRGLHLQTGDFAQAKLVRCVVGQVLDVVVDLRRDSKTFGQTYSLELSEDNFLQLLIPKGFAHGFIVLSEKAIFEYKVDAYYNKESEAGIIYNDPVLDIDWRVPEKEMVVSAKDKELPSFAEFQASL